MNTAEEIRGRARENLIAPSGLIYGVRAVWPVDLHRDGVLPKGTLTTGATGSLGDDEYARLESSLLRHGIWSVNVYDGEAPADMTNAVAVQDIPAEDRRFLVADLVVRSGLAVTALPDAGGSRFRGGTSEEARPDTH